MPNQRRKGLAQANAWVEQEVYDWIVGQAERNGIPVSDVIREVLDDAIKRAESKQARRSAQSRRAK
jgi:hypothetical protein